jgi:hypothetical protein
MAFEHLCPHRLLVPIDCLQLSTPPHRAFLFWLLFAQFFFFLPIFYAFDIIVLHAGSNYTLVITVSALDMLNLREI